MANKFLKQNPQITRFYSHYCRKSLEGNAKKYQTLEIKPNFSPTSYLNTYIFPKVKFCISVCDIFRIIKENASSLSSLESSVVTKTLCKLC